MGSLERLNGPGVKQLHVSARAAGVIENHCGVYAGGHDYARWRGALIDGLRLLPRHFTCQESHPMYGRQYHNKCLSHGAIFSEFLFSAL